MTISDRPPSAAPSKLQRPHPVLKGPAAPGLSMRKRDVRWLTRAADEDGCPLDSCATAFDRLERLGFVEKRTRADLVSGNSQRFARITPAGVDALAKATRVFGDRA